MTWVLILFVGVGALGDGEANSLASVPGFASRAQCEAAGKAASSRFGSGTKRVEFVCSEQGPKAP
jgi:hypothetical protein